MAKSPALPPILTPAEVAPLFGVDAQSVLRWAKAGKLKYFRTLGGHARFRRADIRAALRKAGGAR